MIAFIIYLTQIWFLIALVITAHHLRDRIGLMPLLFLTVSLIVFLNFSNFINVRIQVLPNLILGVAGHVITPVILVSLMIVYIVEGYRLARLELLGLVGANLLAVIMLGFVTIYVNLDVENVIAPGSTNATFFNAVFIQRRIASIIAISGAMVTIAIVFQFVMNTLTGFPLSINIAIAMFAALWTDSFLFFTISGIGVSSLFADLENDLLGKGIASAIALVPVSIYLRTLIQNADNYYPIAGRPTFAIIFGERGQLYAALQKLETELRVSRRVYEELTNHIGEIFWMADSTTEKVIYLSPAFERLTGYKRTDYYRHFDQLQKLIHPKDRFEESGILKKVFEQKSIEFRIIRADGSERWMRNRTFSIDNETGEIYRYAGVMEDITDQKTAREREFELAVAHERMNILQSFIRDASHDLKSPLTSILLRLDMLERNVDEARRSDMIKELRNRVTHLHTLIDDLFTLSRIEGHEIVNTEIINFNEFTSEVVQDFLPQAQSKGLQLLYEPSMEPCFVIANPEQLNRVVSNLLSNAIRYTTEGSITLETSKQDSKVLLKVQDTGMGIPENEISAIFDRFYRSTKTRSTVPGTGLGLAIVKAIVDRYGGQIHVESRPDEGSTFILSMPYTAAEAQDLLAL